MISRIFKKNRKSFAIIFSLTLIFSNLPMASASSPGTVPFAFFKTVGAIFSSIGAHGVPSNSFVTNKYFGFGSKDGMFQKPIASALDSTNNFLFVVDNLNNRIVKMSSTTGAFIGAIGLSTASSGTCPSSGAAAVWCTGGTFSSGSSDGMFSNPTDITYDSVNDAIYVADYNNYRVQKIRASTGAFIGAIGKTSSSTGTCPASGAASGWCTGGVFAAGASDGMFYYGSNLTYDSTRDVIYVVDSYGGRIAKINAATGAFIGAIGNTSASSGTCPASGVTAGWCTGGTFGSAGVDGSLMYPVGIAFDSVNNAIYIPDYSIGRISKFTASTGIFVGAIGKTTASTGTCPASGTATGWCTGGTFSNGASDGQFSNAQGITFDSLNNSIYVADTSYSRIVKLTATTGAFVGAIGMTTSTSGTCPASGAAPGWCTGGVFATGVGDGMVNSAYGVVADSVNNLIYISDSQNNRIVKVTASTGVFVAAAGLTAVAGTGWEKTTGSIAGPADGMYPGWNIAYDSVHNVIYSADYSNYRIAKIDASTGAFVGAIGKTLSSKGTCPASGTTTGWCTGGIFGSGTADGQFGGTTGITYDSVNDALYIVDRFRIMKFVGSTGVFVGSIGKVLSSTGSCPASGVTNGWCTGGTFDTGINNTDGSFSYPGGLAYDSTNNAIYVADRYRVTKFTATTGVFVGSVGKTTATTGSCPASGATPGWCTGGTYGSGSTDGTYYFIYYIAYDAGNNAIYVADTFKNKISKITATTGAFVGGIGKTTSSTGTCPASGAAPSWCTGGLFAGGAGDGMISNPTGIAFDSVNNAIYISDYDNYRIDKFTASTGVFVGSIGKTTATSGTCPASGTANDWCKGGTFTSSSLYGGFSELGNLAYDAVNKVIYISDGARILRRK